MRAYNIWNRGTFNEDAGAYGRVSFIFGDEDYALLEIVNDEGEAVVSYRLEPE